MKEELEQRLYEKYPEIFDVNFRRCGIAVGDGWYDIIDTLCEELLVKRNNLERHVQYMRKVAESKPADIHAEMELALSELRLEEANEAIPRASQVKEKFGGLRFYVDGGDEVSNRLISFAESLSVKTCEVCGAPGRQRDGGWIKTLCEHHHEEHVRRIEERTQRLNLKS